MDNNMKIVLVSYQHSVVVRGIENNLKELGYAVATTGNNPAEIRPHCDNTNVFILYLADDILGDYTKVRDTSKITDYIREKGQNMIVIGEKTIHDDCISAIPVLREYIWLNRPIETDTLVTAIKNASERKTSSHDDSSSSNSLKRILIVDDDPAYAKMVRTWLKDMYQMSIVTAGMQAITFLMKNKVDLILLDYEMPVVDGPQILEMLKSEPETAGIPVIFLTGVGTRESIERVMALKPAGYILKSTTREDLTKYLKAHFAK
ncbi:MAG: response regulator [Lachnospiraceae bacterium]|nr:response regulator [Lachnospiraceae bacterium]